MNLTDYRDITALLQRHGFRFSKSMGQNFLTAAWVPQQIAAESGITAADGALEIGPGVGCLTAELAKTAGRVTAVELDELPLGARQRAPGLLLVGAAGAAGPREHRDGREDRHF